MKVKKYISGKQRKVAIADYGGGEKYHSFVLFDDTVVGEGGWLQGRWMIAKQLLEAENRWVAHSYDTRADNILKTTDLSPEFKDKLKQIDDKYDLTAGVAQCGGCKWFAALDCDYGMCCNEESLNDGRLTFEHGGCIKHSSIVRLLNELEVAEG